MTVHEGHHDAVQSVIKGVREVAVTRRRVCRSFGWRILVGRGWRLA